ncbi:MAG TPA: hypothetical protein VHR45_13520 [Thermoanaerobaculia bacterium]|nr:hypothetical protein [Thermoanaerobaculia bacterium]
MVPELRRAYNAAFTEGRYRAMLDWLEEQAGFPIPFRICETPLFLSQPLTAELHRAAREMLSAVTSAAYLRAAEKAIPPGFAVPGEDAHTTFLQVDFALVEEAGGGLSPRLIELQGFPSLYGFQWLLERAFHRHFELPADLTPYFGGLTTESYTACLRAVIVGDADPENVVLLEIDPERQKTRVDFTVIEQLLGVRAVSATEVIVRGERLFYRDNRRGRRGREVPIRRIYNRVIFDELERRQVNLDHLFRRPLDVTWVGHPNWFWKISKFSLPFIHSRYAPESHFLADLEELPPDLDNYVLKPLFSFAGLGVEVGVTAERLRAIERPEDYILQRRVDYAPVIATPDDPAKAEVRMMFLWRDRPRLVNSLVRTTKGKMVGVDFNKDRTWVGASIALHPPEPAPEIS